MIKSFTTTEPAVQKPQQTRTNTSVRPKSEVLNFIKQYARMCCQISNNFPELGAFAQN